MRGLQFHEAFMAFSRKKKFDSPGESGLVRRLSTLDLIFMGIGSTLGVGVYVMAAQIAAETAGPAVVVSFAIAALASMFAGLCYAEFGARVPKAGSAYIYSYVTVGEFIAFLIGWSIILEYVIGSASVVRALSDYVDSLFDNAMKNAFMSAAPINVENLSSYPDFFAFAITMAFSAALAFGATESAVANNIFTLVNLAIVLFVICAGSIKADTSNWKLDVNKVNCSVPNCKKGTGGFAPFGITGIINGAARCFYTFIGFDCVATASEEAKDPKKSIPIAIVASLTVVFLAYFGVSTVVTTVLPYYEQNINTPLPHMFTKIGWDWAKWVVSVGAICALCASLLGAIFPLPRVIYAMASDGLIFQWMGNINSRFHTPMMGTFSAGVLTATLAAIFEVKQLSDMMSIGTLLAYSIVAACVLILRYEGTEGCDKKIDGDLTDISLLLRQLVNANRLHLPTRFTANIVKFLVSIYVALCFCLTVLIRFGSEAILMGDPWLIGILVILCCLLGLILFFIYCQPSSSQKLAFTVPFVPFLPAISILINVYLMITLSLMTWIRFTIWMLLGLLIYFSYGVWHSKCREKPSVTTVDVTHGN